MPPPIKIVLVLSVAITLVPRIYGFERVVVLGDSLSDNGNTATRSFGFSPGGNPYFAGRFSNGPVWTEHLITALGLGTTSKNYAYGGGQSASGQTVYSQGFFTIGIPNTGWDTGVYEGSQYDLFVDDFVVTDDLSDDLFLIGGGAVNYFTQGETTHAPAGNLIQLIKDLYDLGGREFMVSNLPDLGLTPSGLFEGPDPVDPDPIADDVTSAQLSSYTMDFNAELLLQIGALRADSNYAGISLYELDLFGFMNEVMQNPIGSITNVTDAAMDQAGAPTDPADPFYDTYLFFDGTHPTAFAHQAIANEAMLVLTPVPEPQSVALIGAAFLLAASRRREGGI